MPDYTKLNQEIIKSLRQSLSYRDIRLGWLGKITAADTINPTPADGLEEPYVWVRFGENGEAVRAVCKISRRLPDLPVKVGRDALTGEWTVIEAVLINTGDVSSLLSTFSVPDRNDDYIYERIDPNRFRPLHVIPGATAFDVEVEPGLYWYQGELKAWEGDTINITASLPTGGFGGSKRGVLIGIDPATDTLTTHDGDVVGILVTPGNQGKYFTATYIADTVNAADPAIYWIAMIPLTSLDSDWQSLYRVTALQLTGTFGTASAGHEVRVNGVDQTQRGFINFIDGNGVDIVGTDDSPNDETELTFTVNQSELSLANLGTRNFTNLADVPSSYAGQALKGVRVNAAANALEFVDYTGQFVQKTGDTMTGALGIISTAPSLTITATNLLGADSAAQTYGITSGYAVNQNGHNLTADPGALGVFGAVSVVGATGTVTGAAGVVGAVSKTNGGTLTNAYALYATSASKTAGTLTNNYGLYVAAQTVGTNNYAIYTNAGLVRLGDSASITQSAGSGTVAGLLAINAAAHTALTASAERTEVDINLGVTQQWATGALTTQRFVRLRQPTMGFVGSSTVTTAVTFDIEGAPVAGTNATLTNSIALRVGGRTQINATVDIVPPAATGTQLASVLLTAPAHTALTASTEYTDVYLNLNRLVQWATGNMSLQRAMRITAPSYRAVGTSTFTTAITLDIEGPPVASTNMTIGTALALRVGGRTQINGAVDLNPPATAGGAPSAFVVVGAAHISVPALEYNDIYFNLQRSVQFTTGGSISTQRAIRITPPTYTATSATQTIVDAYTMEIVGPPVAGSNVSITNSRAFHVASGVARFSGQVQINNLMVFVDGNNITVGTSTGTKIGTATTEKLALWNKTPIVRPTALTTQLTTVTHAAIGTPDYAIADLVAGGFGFVAKDEGTTVLSVIANLQTRLSELETRLSNFGFLP